MRLVTVISLVGLFSIARSQVHDNDPPNACNVVCNCNSDKGADAHPTGTIAPQGPPGKRGAAGERGEAGFKGEQGEPGIRGQKGTAGKEIKLSDVLQAMNANSCQELSHTYGIEQTGYYLMLDRIRIRPVYRYCDFRRYTNIGSCEELFTNSNITEAGYYLLGIASEGFQFCSPSFRGLFTCQDLQYRYELITESGYYNFTPPDSDPYRVFCNFSQNQVMTEVGHDITGERRALPECENAGCFAATPTYELPETAIRKIIENSASCRQFIKLKCKGVTLNGYAWWVSKDGRKLNYWGGSTRKGYCACGETNTCIDNSHKCNCDQNSGSIITSDEGYLTAKNLLPIKQIRLGDMGDSSESGWYVMGKLECFGRA